MVASVDHLATAAGVDVLAHGGNAVDAALATHAVLAVTAPHLCGLGGDLFALVHDGSAAPAALDASGRAGSGADPDRLRAEGATRMPFQGDVRSVPVPGCVDGLVALHERYGTRPLADLFARAVQLADDGFPASPLLVRPAARLVGTVGATDLLAATHAGARVRRPGVARTLRGIAARGRDAFYGGELGEGLLALGAVDRDVPEFVAGDLERLLADWVAPVSAPAWGHVVWSTPPASSGYLVTLGAAIADGLDLPDDPADPLWAHLLVEAARAAGHDRPDVLAEGAAPPDDAAARRAGIAPDVRAPRPEPVQRDGDTTYLCAADGGGLAVSLIQSNAAGFGSGLFEPRTGINLQNRGYGFSLVPGHRAEYGPGRRPPHTLAPVVVTRPDGALRAVLGTMGGDAQPQVLLQLLARMLRGGEDAGAAVDGPRWRLGSGATGFDTWTADVAAAPTVEVEHGARWSDGLRARGHVVVDEPAGVGFGHAHAIEVTADGTFAGAADPRARVGAASGV